MSATGEVSRFIAGSDGRAIPAEAIALARTAFIDVTATTLAGAAQPVGRIVTDWVREAGGAPHASVVAAAFRTSTAQAALANGTMAHALLYEDTTFVSMAHTTVALAPALLAIGEQAGASGRSVLEAYVIGYELCPKRCSRRAPTCDWCRNTARIVGTSTSRRRRDEAFRWPRTGAGPTPRWRSRRCC